MTSSVTLNPGYFSRRSLADWGFALLAALGMVMIVILIAISLIARAVGALVRRGLPALRVA